MTSFDLLPHGIDQSILPAVLVGLFVMLFLTESFGWVFAGLIVPGYLASVFVFSPFSGVAVLLEAVLTFVVARFVSDRFSRSGVGIEFFGRERFLLLLVVAVLVRQVSELWLLPEAARLLDGAFGTTLRLDGSLSGIGLVLVPITANSFWKLDVPRGLWQVGLPTLLTYLVVAYVLVPYTNLSFSHHEVTYEDAALDFLGGPKIYIVLLSGAYLASRYNLDYGWDYNGILVPGLMALTWFEPLRVVTTLLEALVLWALARSVVRLPLVRRLQLEGPRRIVFVFTLGVALRSLVALTVGERSPELRAIDLFGFGYLLSSLLAAKMLQTKVIGRVLLPTAQVSFAGFALGSLLGLGFESVLPAPAEATERRSEPPPSLLVEDGLERVAFASAARALLELPPGDASNLEPVAGLLAAVLREPTEERVHRLEAAAPADLRVERLGARLLVVREEERSLAAVRGRDTAILRLGAPGPILEVRHPLREPEAVGFALALCARLDCSLLTIAAVDRGSPPAPAWLLEVARDGGRPRVVVRHAVSGGSDEIRVDGAVATSIPLATLLPGARVVLRADEEEGPHPAIVVRGTRASLLGHVPPILVEPARRASEWLFVRADEPEAARTEPNDVEFRFLAELVLAPLLEAGVRGEGPDGVGVRLAAQHAAPIGHRVIFLPDGMGPAEPVLLLVAGSAPAGRWGAVAVRVGEAEPVVFVAPESLREPGTDRLAYALFAASRARALFVGSRTQRDGSPEEADLLSPAFAFHTAAHRTFTALRALDPLLFHVRGFDPLRAIPEPLVVGLGAPLLEDAPTSPRLGSWLIGDLASFGPPRLARSEPDTLGLDGWRDPSLRFSMDLGDATAALLWFSEPARRPFAERHDVAALLETPSRGIERWEGGAHGFFALERRGERIVAELDPQRLAEVEAACAALEAAARGRSPHPLRQLLETPGARAHLGRDPVAGAAFLAITIPLGDVELRALAFPSEPVAAPLRLGPDAADALDDALLRRDRILFVLTRAEALP